MKLILVVEPAAEKDMLSGYRWYEERRVGLGVKFLEALEALFDHILENPLLYVELIPSCAAFCNQDISLPGILCVRKKYCSYIGGDSCGPGSRLHCRKTRHIARNRSLEHIKSFTGNSGNLAKC